MRKKTVSGQTLAGETVYAKDVLANSLDHPTRILNIARKARENQEEKGLQTLYLALGFASWKAEDSRRDYRAPKCYTAGLSQGPACTTITSADLTENRLLVQRAHSTLGPQTLLGEQTNFQYS